MKTKQEIEAIKQRTAAKLAAEEVVYEKLSAAEKEQYKKDAANLQRKAKSSIED